MSYTKEEKEQILLEEQEKQLHTFFDVFKDLNDPRDERGKRHKLIDVIVISIYGMLCGYIDFTNLADWAEVHEDYFTELLDLKYGVPSHCCFSRVFWVIDPKEFMELFMKWVTLIVDTVGKHIAIDGKAVRSATNKLNCGNTPYILSALLTDIGFSIGQVKIDDKTNEITAIPELIRLINIEGAVISIDAIGTQTDIIDSIKAKKAHFCLNVKDNQELLKQDIKEYYEMALNDKEEMDKFIIKETSDNAHGRIETRKYYLIHSNYCITDPKKWKYIASIGVIHSTRQIKNKKIKVVTANGIEIKDDTYKTDEIKFYILDIKPTIDEFIGYTRNHWAIETYHWLLDVQYREDWSKSRKGHSISNLSMVRKIILNLSKCDNNMPKPTTQSRITRYSSDFKNIEKLIFEELPRI